MLAFIKSQPSVVENLLRHIEVPPFVDLLTRVIQLDELPEGAGTLEVRVTSSILLTAKCYENSGYRPRTSFSGWYTFWPPLTHPMCTR